MRTRNTGDSGGMMNDEDGEGEGGEKAKQAEIRKLTNSLKSVMKEKGKKLLLNFIMQGLKNTHTESQTQSRSPSLHKPTFTKESREEEKSKVYML